MKLLIDNALSPQISQDLKVAGYDSVHVREYNMQKSSDKEIFRVAEKEQRAIISADTDFGALLAIRGKTSPSFILLRKNTNLRPKQIASQLIRILDEYSKEIEEGCVLTITDKKIRIRNLPIE